MSHVYPDVEEGSVLLFVAEQITKLQETFKQTLPTVCDEEEQALRISISNQALILFRLVMFFGLILHPEISDELANLMVNWAIYR